MDCSFQFVFQHRMLKFIFVSIFILAAHGIHIPTSQPKKCGVISDQVKRLLEASNRDFKIDSIPVYTEGINQYIRLSIDGTSMPSQVFLNTSTGELRSLPTLSLSRNASMCSDGEHITLEGLFEFDTLDLYFNVTRSTYELPLHQLKSTGTFTYNVKPTVNIFIDKYQDDCHLDSYSIATTDSVDYRFQPNSGPWLGRKILAYILRHALRGADTTPLLYFVLEGTKEFVESYFTKAWCASLNPIN